MRLLVVEDEPKLLKMLVHLFEMNHYLPDGGDNGNDALAFALTDEYYGFVLDTMMLGMDCVTVFAKLQQKFICLFYVSLCDKNTL